MKLPHPLLLVSLSLLTPTLATSVESTTTTPAIEARGAQEWVQWLNKVASGVSMTIYNSPKLDGTVAEISRLLGEATDVLTKLGLSGPRIENRLPDQCPAIIIIYTRGTSEAKNVGTIVGPPAFKTLRKDIGDEKKVAVQGVEWDALLSTYQFGGDPKGIADMVKQTTSAAKDCASKKSQIVLAGFSQGALMTRAAIKQLPMTIMEKVSAVILWGDPAKREDAKLPAPVPLIDGTSIPGSGGKVHVVCHALDAFCHNSNVTTPFHYIYFKWGRQEAVDFILKQTGVKKARRARSERWTADLE